MWRCLSGSGLGLDYGRDFISSGLVYSRNRLLGSSRESLFDREETMFNIKRAFLNKGQTEDSKKGNLVEKRRSNVRIVFEYVGKIFGAVSDQTVDVGVKGCLCLLMECCCLKMCYNAF